MDPKDLFLMQHGAVHSVNVAGNKASLAERVLGNVSDEQMRLRPREDLNSIAWLIWHIARAEDVIVNPVLSGLDQVLDEKWLHRLGVTRRDFGIGMTSAEVGELTQQIDIPALKEYRDAVGMRTREVVGDFRAQDWEGTVERANAEKAAASGAFGARGPALVQGFSGRPRVMALSGIAIIHPANHLGEATTVRSAGGFGTGI